MRFIKFLPIGTVLSLAILTPGCTARESSDQKRERDRLAMQIDEAHKDRDIARADLEREKAEVALLQRETRAAADAIDAARAETTRLNDALNNALASAEEGRAAAQRLQIALTDLEEAKARADTATRRASELEGQLDDLRTQVDVLRQRLEGSATRPSTNPSDSNK